MNAPKPVTACQAPREGQPTSSGVENLGTAQRFLESATGLSSTQRAARVKLMIFDVDGVLTDGRLYYGDQGEMLKTFDTLDGHGIKLLAAVGIASAIITGRKSGIVEARARELGIAHIYQGVHDKTAAFADLLAVTGLNANACAYMGDDWPDLPVMLKVGFATAPANAHPEVIARAHWVAEAKGGRGAVREACDAVLRAGNHYEALLAAACES
jgi:3-deoxy-D-manno-octulosonate 8-phosphate phosphatase (KDO 8-P phosphatase)